MSDIFSSLLLAETKRRLFEESYARIELCLSRLDENQIWYRPNEASNSVGNLVLHLIGNARQWIVAALGQHEDIRKRQAEFDARQTHQAADLLAALAELKADILVVLDGISAPALTKTYEVQHATETGVSVLVHVIEHFSYHVGQITYITKMLTNTDTGYYEGQNLD